MFGTGTIRAQVAAGGPVGYGSLEVPEFIGLGLSLETALAEIPVRGKRLAGGVPRNA